MRTTSDYRLTKYVGKWLDKESGKWFPIDWSDLHEISDRQVEKIRRSLNRSLGKEGINAHASAAMGHRVWFTKCRIVKRKTRRLIYRSK